MKSFDTTKKSIEKTKNGGNASIFEVAQLVLNQCDLV